MASLDVTGIDELSRLFTSLGNVPWDVTEKALNAMAEVAKVKVKAAGEAMGVRDPESKVHILDKITAAKAKQTESGGRQDITFSGTRTRGEGRTKTRNAEIAFINEFGKRNQPARPFIKQAAEQYEKAITDPGAEILGDWIEKTFEN